MQDMHPDVGYIPGKKNIVTDFLSRYDGLGVSQDDASNSHFNINAIAGLGVQAVRINAEVLQKQQQGDDSCTHAMDFLKKANLSSADDMVYYPRWKVHIGQHQGALVCKPSSRKGFIDSQKLFVAPRSGHFFFPISNSFRVPRLSFEIQRAPANQSYAQYQLLANQRPARLQLQPIRALRASSTNCYVQSAVRAHAELSHFRNSSSLLINDPL